MKAGRGSKVGWCKTHLFGLLNFEQHVGKAVVLVKFSDHFLLIPMAHGWTGLQSVRTGFAATLGAWNHRAPWLISGTTPAYVCTSVCVDGN